MRNTSILPHNTSPKTDLSAQKTQDTRVRDRKPGTIPNYAEPLVGTLMQGGEQQSVGDTLRRWWMMDHKLPFGITEY